MKQERLLVVRTGGLGDIIMSLAALRALRKSSNSHVTLLCSSEAAPVIAGTGVYDEIVSFRRTKQRFAGCIDQSRLDQLIWLTTLRHRSYSKTLVLQPLLTQAGALRSRCMVKMAGAPSYGRNTDGRGRFFTHSTDEALDSDLHEVERAMRVVGLLGIDGPRDISLAPNRECVSGVRKELRASGVGNGELLIGVNAGSFRPANRWPAERFAQAAERLREASGASIVLIGSRSESDIAAHVASQIRGHCVSLVGKTTLAELVALLASVDLLLTNDTGTMHLAAALGTPLVAPFANSDPRRTAPYALHGKARVVTNHLCGRHSCRRRECMLNISVDHVVQAALGVLETSRSGSLA